MTKSIEERADDYSTLFIQEYTKFQTDGHEHRELTALFEEFAEILKVRAQMENICKIINR